MPTTPTGRLRDRIVIERWDGRQEPQYGAETGDWVAIAEVWAEVRQVTGRELLVGDQTVVVVTHAVAIRYRAGLVPRMRVVWRGNKLGIAAILDEEDRRRFLTLECFGAA